MIIYFTGTGNSKLLAELIGRETSDEVVDSTALVRDSQHPSFISEKPYVFVAPTYAWRLPRVFDGWIRNCSFQGNQKAYFVLNCGSGIGAAGGYARELCDGMGLTYMGIAKVLMPENYIAMFCAPSEEKAQDIITAARKQTIELSKAIVSGSPFDKVRNTPLGHLCSGVVNDCFYKFFITDKKFYTTSACISCGQCAKVCMLNNVTLKDGKPVWGGNCTHCMACICKCPAEAIEYGRHSKGLRRYVCPEE